MPPVMPDASFGYSECPLQQNHGPALHHLLQGLETHNRVPSFRHTSPQIGLLSLHLRGTRPDETDEHGYSKCHVEDAAEMLAAGAKLERVLSARASR